MLNFTDTMLLSIFQVIKQNLYLDLLRCTRLFSAAVEFIIGKGETASSGEIGLTPRA